MLQRPTDETDPGDWFLFAADRLKGADVLWQNEGLTMMGIEGLQEAAERFLKGYLIAQGWRLVKTHDLRRLIQDAEQKDSRFVRFRRFANVLTEDFFAQHYPGGDLTDVGKEYQQLRGELGELVSLIQGAVPQYFPKTT